MGFDAQALDASLRHPIADRHADHRIYLLLQGSEHQVLRMVQLGRLHPVHISNRLRSR